MKYFVTRNGVEQVVSLRQISSARYTCQIDDGEAFDVDVMQEGGRVHLLKSNRSLWLAISPESQDLSMGGPRTKLLVESEIHRALKSASGADDATGSGGLICSPMPGKVVKNLVAEGDRVVPNQGVVVIEAMKMENELKSAVNGTVVKLYATAGELVDSNEPLIEIRADDDLGEA